MVGDNSLSVKECVCEANSLAWKEMQHIHWKELHTWETLLAKELPSAPVESSLAYWAQIDSDRINLPVFSSHSVEFWGLWS